ncbi:Nucleoside diphosphate kinase [Ceraceosorus bombacis]|uniref:Nucleoside diphosphate kinase n=1 Tax=Ceraceosorus bombacis TaxID=401625 RepID=A0A0P1BQL4_9BASI|nr:Nucleoside diphosphate kinase [Ceraceosorus bombacis]
MLTPSKATPNVPFPSPQIGLPHHRSSPNNSVPSSPFRLAPSASQSALTPSPRHSLRSRVSPAPSVAPPLEGRVLAILLKSAAKVHRSAILNRAASAGLRCIAERTERWLADTDGDFLDAFLLHESSDFARSTWAHRLTRGDIRVLVLEGPGGTDTWTKLMGRDHEVEGPAIELDDEEGPDEGLRRTFGDAAVYGSSKEHATERQIAICFPEFAKAGVLDAFAAEATIDSDVQSSAPRDQADVDEQEGTSALPLEDSMHHSSAHSRVDSADAVEPIDVPDVDEADEQAHVHHMSRENSTLILSADDVQYDEGGRAFAPDGTELALEEELHSTYERGGHAPVVDDELSRPSSSHTSTHDPAARLVAKGSPSGSAFRARPLPASTHSATRQPRLSRAAALRMGVDLPAPPVRKATEAEKNAASNDSIELGISGLRKAKAQRPTSIAQPTTAPRMNRAAAIRAGIELPPAPVRKPSTEHKKVVDTGVELGISGVPKTKAARPASIAGPTQAPRMNRAAAIRAGLELPPTAPRTRAISSATNGTDVSKSSSVGNVGISGLPRAEAAKPKSLQAPSVVPRGNRASVARGVNDPTGSPTRSMKQAVNGAQPTPQADYTASGHRRGSQSVSSIKALGTPSIAPRSNNAATRRLSVHAFPSAGDAPSTDGALSSRPASSMGSARPRSAAGRSSNTGIVMGRSQSAASRPAGRASSVSGTVSNDTQTSVLRAKAPPSSFRGFA